MSTLYQAFQSVSLWIHDVTRVNPVMRQTHPLFLLLPCPPRGLFRPPGFPLLLGAPQQLVLQLASRAPLSLRLGLSLLASLFHHLIVLGSSLLGFVRIGVGRMGVREGTEEIGVVIRVLPDGSGRVRTGVNVERVAGLWGRFGKSHQSL